MKIAVVLSAAALLLCTGVALAQPYAPPPLPPESGVPPPIPGPRGHFELIPGHWRWDGVRYVWEPRHWIARAAGFAHWVPGHWGTGPYGRWIWIEGHWVR